MELPELQEHKPGPETRFYDEGWNAAVAGLPRDANPYKNEVEAMIPYRCVHGHQHLPGIRNGAMYEKVCVGTHITTLQELVTYRGLDGADAGRCFHTTLSHWGQAFEEVTGTSEPAGLERNRK